MIAEWDTTDFVMMEKNKTLPPEIRGGERGLIIFDFRTILRSLALCLKESSLCARSSCELFEFKLVAELDSNLTSIDPEMAGGDPNTSTLLQNTYRCLHTCETVELML